MCYRFEGLLPSASSFPKPCPVQCYVAPSSFVVFAKHKSIYDVLLDHIKKKKHWTREERGDHLFALTQGLPPQKPTLGSMLKPSTLVHACFSTVAQIDHLGAEFATGSHRNLLKARGLLVPEEELVSSHPFAGSDVLQGLIIDDFFCISVEGQNFVPGTSKAKARFCRASRTYAAEGLLNSPHKDIVEAQKAKIAGAELDASEPTRRHGLVPLGSPVAWLWHWFLWRSSSCGTRRTLFMPVSWAVGLLP